MKELIKEALINELGKLFPDANADAGIDFQSLLNIDRPADLTKGDYSTSVALSLGSKLKKNPVSIAIDLCERLNKSSLISDSAESSFSKIEVAGPGFINFFLSRQAQLKELQKIAGAESGAENGLENSENAYGSSKKLENQKIVIEYTDPNPFKVFHIGHLMSNTIGEALSRLEQNAGADLKRYCYQGDVGRHVALTFYGLRFLGENWPDDSTTISEKVAFLGRAYAKGATHFKNHLEDEEIVQSLNKNIYYRDDAEVNELYDKGKEWSLEHFEEIYKILGTQFDQYFFESAATPIGLKEVQDGLEKGIFEKSDGAVIFKGENYGLHTRVFVNKFGLPTYEAKEVGLAKLKYEAWPYDKSFTITANEQDEMLKVTYKAIEQIYPDIVKKNFHISHGMLRLTTGKMSSRTGDVISGESLIHEMIEMSKSKINEEKKAENSLTPEEIQKIAEQVGVAAIKYSILKQNTNKDIIFDPQKSLSFEGDSGPYLQYTCVRAQSILNKSKEIIKEIEIHSFINSQKPLETEKILSLDFEGGVLEKLLIRLPEVMDRAEEEGAPHHVAQYATALASEFNSFYANTQIIKEGDPLMAYKVYLTKATKIVLTKALWSLGIEVPERM